MHCINISHPDYQELEKSAGIHPSALKAMISVWMDKNGNEKFPTLEQLNIAPGTVNATLKIINALDKIQRNVFTQDKMQGWLNDLQKQGVSAQQLDIFKQTAKPGMSREEIAAAIAANYSYTIEINTATKDVTKELNQRLDSSEEEYNSIQAEEVELLNSPGITKTFYKTFGNNTYTKTITTNPITGKEEKPQYFISSKTINKTDYYSNLTVPGGTNYTEQEIATPAITPSIKGHAQFATDKGIGWFRSDEATNIVKKEEALNERGTVDYNNFSVRNDGKGNYVYLSNKGSKTRRILEIQSDLFQKGRDKSLLVDVTNNINSTYSFVLNGYRYDKDGAYETYSKYNLKNTDKKFEDISEEEYNKAEEEIQKSNTGNEFLQLLNKDNNWVTFFVKSIIQDSAKKGYEKVLFPSGNTASKVEGHTTLEEFKKEKENRIKALEKQSEIKELDEEDLENLEKEGYNINQDNFKLDYSFYEKEGILFDQGSLVYKKNDKYFIVDSSVSGEIIQLKQELERVEGPEGFGALKPIYNFYENTVVNVLKKQGYSPKQVTDEYGNTWNEVEIKEPQAKEAILYQKKKLNYYQQAADDIYWNYVYGKTLSKSELDELNKALLNISKTIGDTDWSLRLSKNGNYYIAGYKNMAVTSADYYSPFANKMFRQLESKSQEAPVEELTKKLYVWAKLHGIEISAINDLIERFGDRYEKGILGVADFANALIGIADDAKLDTLPEEIGHFAVEIMINDPSVQRALETVVNTTAYSVVKEDYKDIYTEEIQFRKEALGKILAQEIVSQFKETQDLAPEERGFWAYLKAIKEKFFKWVKSKFSNKDSVARKELETTIMPLAKGILDGQYLGALVKENYLPEDKLFSIEKEQAQENQPEEQEVKDPIIENKEKFLKEVIAQLSSRLVTLSRSAKSQVTIGTLEKEIQLLEYKLAKQELDLAISSFVKLGEEEIKTVKNSLLKGRASGIINNGTVFNSMKFVEMYENIFNSFIQSVIDNKIPYEETEEVRKLIHNLIIELTETRGIAQNLLNNAAKVVVDAANTDANGEKIDKDFDSGKMLDDTAEDVSIWRFQVGNYKYADSKIIKAAHKIIFDSVAKVKRFATGVGNDLLRAQENLFKSGGKIQDLIELDENGNPTHFFIREYQWSKYYAKMDEAKAKMAADLGFEDYSQIQVVFLNPAELIAYNKAWRNFFEQNTVKKKVISDAGENMEITVPNDSFRNARFDEIMANPATKAYYDLLIKTKKEAVNKLPVQYRTEKTIYMVPPILKSTLERLEKVRGGKSFMSTMATLGRESLFIDANDTQFGENSSEVFKQLNVLNNKMVPIHFTRKLDSVENLSYDVARSVTLFSEMAENFQEMNKISGDLGALQYALAERNYFTDAKRTQRKKGVESLEYATLENLMDSHVFGIERKALATNPIPENRITKALGIAGKQFSGTKASQRFSAFIRNNNLAFNIPTALSAWLKGTGDSIIEDAIGIYTTTESKNWARLEFGSNLFQVLGEVGKAKQTNKMHLMLQQAEVVSLEKMLYETTRTRGARKLLNRDVMYTNFSTGDYGIKGRIALAIYDNYRLHNNQFLTRYNFFQKRIAENGGVSDRAFDKQISKEWADLREKSLYNAYEVIDGNLSVKPEFKKYVTDKVLNSAKGKIEHVTTYVDGTLSATDKGKLSRSIAGDFLLMHRGWFIGLIDTRFKREGTTLITEEEEIGTYRATGSFLYNAFYKTLIKDKAGLQASFATWHTLSPARKRGVMKTGLDLLYLNLVAFIAGLANLAADDADDEDWTTQYMAYQLNRLLLEQGAAWSPAELANMIDEPVVGARMIKDLLDFSEAFNPEVYESGMYKGSSHAGKFWFRKQPLKNVYEMQFPELKNRFIKTMTDSKWYEWMTPEQGHSVTSSNSFVNWFIPSGLGQDADSKNENMQVIIQDLQEDPEEYNEFN